MTQEEIKERAYTKIHSRYELALTYNALFDNYWKIDKDRAKELEEADKKDLEVYSYILSLIEKDNKL